jgi:hypothetical protein
MTEPDSRSSQGPDSSKVNSPVVRRTKPERRWGSWCGELKDLRRLVTMMEELAEQRRAQMLAELADDDENERKRWANRNLLIKIELADGADSISGPSEAVLEELDRRTVKSVKISTNFPGYEEKISLVLQKGGSYDNYGVRLDIESTNPGWAKQCLAQLSDEVDKSVPKWSFFLSIRGRVFALAVVLAGTLGVASLIEARYAHGDLGIAVAITALILVPLGTPIVLIGMSIWPWMFPRFELYGEGGSSSGGRRLAALILFVASIFAGVMVNLIT